MGPRGGVGVGALESINRSLTKGCAKDIISPLWCSSPMRGKGVLPVGPRSGAGLYHNLDQMMAVRGGLGVRVGGCLGAVCLANGVSGAVGFGLVAAYSLIFFCLCAMMPRSIVCAKEQIIR